MKIEKKGQARTLFLQQRCCSKGTSRCFSFGSRRSRMRRVRNAGEVSICSRTATEEQDQGVARHRKNAHGGRSPGGAGGAHETNFVAARHQWASLLPKGCRCPPTQQNTFEIIEYLVQLSCEIEISSKLIYICKLRVILRLRV